MPKDLREAIGKTELRTPLGADYREALKMLPSAVAQLQNQIGKSLQAIEKLLKAGLILNGVSVKKGFGHSLIDL